MARLTDFDLAAFVEASCVRHGVPLKVTDCGVHARVALLLTGRAVRGDAERRADAHPGSDPPNEINPVGVEHGTPLLHRSDHGMIQHSAHDGVLPGQVEIPPLTA